MMSRGSLVQSSRGPGWCSMPVLKSHRNLSHMVDWFGGGFCFISLFVTRLACPLRLIRLASGPLQGLLHRRDLLVADFLAPPILLPGWHCLACRFLLQWRLLLRLRRRRLRCLSAALVQPQPLATFRNTCSSTSQAPVVHCLRRS